MRGHALPGLTYWSGLNCHAVTGTVLVNLYAPLSTRDDSVSLPPDVLVSENSGPLRSGTHLSRIVCRPPALTVTCWWNAAGPSTRDASRRMWHSVVGVFISSSCR